MNSREILCHEANLMLYPAYIHTGDERHAHGILFPDFPGCFAAADHWENIPKAAQQALECHTAGEDQPIPRPTPLEKLTHQPDYQDGGIWMLIDIDTNRLDGPSQRINISLPRNLLAEIDAYTRSHAATRSGFLADAARKAMAEATNPNP